MLAWAQDTLESTNHDLHAKPPWRGETGNEETNHAASW